MMTQNLASSPLVLYDGLDAQGKIENLTIFGARSISVFRCVYVLVV